MTKIFKADLHIHSNYSDGTKTERQIFHLAKQAGLSLISITDHDCLGAGGKNYELSKEFGVKYIHGIEISAYDSHRGNKCHIIGLGFERTPSLISFIEEIEKRRHNNTLEKLHKLQKLGYEITEQEIKSQGPRGAYFKQHLMKVLIEKGHAKTLYGEFYQKMFKSAGPLSGDIEYPPATQAIRLIKEAGGIPVLAHPTQYGSLPYLSECVEAGLMGIEAFHHSISPADHAEILKLAKKHGLLISGGSDYHGENGETLLGEYFTTHQYSAELFTEIENRIKTTVF